MEGWCFEMSTGPLRGSLLRARRKSGALVLLLTHPWYSFTNFAIIRVMASNVYQVKSHKVALP